MAESTLNIAWQEFQARTASFLGWGRGANYGDQAWDSQQQFELDGIVGSAIRNVYFLSNYDWSYLHPVLPLDFPAGASTIPLPDDWGAPEGAVTVLSNTQSSQPWRICWRNEAQIRGMYSSLPNTSGPPQYVAEVPLKGTTGTQSTRKQLILFPMADQHYTLQVAYYLCPDYPSPAFPYLYGGAQLAECFLEACLAIAEERLDDARTVHADKYEIVLAAAINNDRKNKAQSLGPNLDQSDNQRIMDRSAVHWFAPPATLNGVPFT